ncbi:MAG: response regulator transcription factor [Paludibacteraceae bacterium]|jgi:DNA-binding response OmpR family regulator|nr:response regulator transcription factor [Paludibacteraceae bacterium]
MATKNHILLVEDDLNLSTVLADYLQSKEYQVTTAANGQEAWELLSHKHFDILLTDISMPKKNGWQLMKSVRESGMLIPIIVLSAKTDREDIIRGYQLGCDDYLTKPFSMDILICKIEAILRRYRMASQTDEMEFDLNGLHFDAVRQTLGDKRLSSRENELLLMLCQNMDKTVERSRILMTLWGSDTYFNSRSLSVYVNHLRNYIGKDNVVKILSVHGKGYKLVKMNE